MSTYERYRKDKRRQEHLREIDEIVMTALRVYLVITAAAGVLLALSGVVWVIVWIIGE